MVRLTSKPVIQKIKFTKSEQEEIDKINKHEPIKRIRNVTRKYGSTYDFVTNRPITPEMSKKRFVQLYGGLCTGCGVNWPDYKFTYNVGDEKQPAKKLERYCQNCYDKKWKSGNKSK